MDPQRTHEFHTQDWLIIFEALLWWASPGRDISGERIDRAQELVDAIAAEQGLPHDELAEQIDPRWAGPK